MFANYLINVLMTASTYWVFALVVFLISFVYVRKKLPDFYGEAKSIAIALFFVGLALGLLSSGNTYKNTVDDNRVQDLQKIERTRELQETKPIEDRTSQPMTAEERAATSVDMRDRVEQLSE